MSGPQKVASALRRDGPATLNEVAETVAAAPKHVATWLARAEQYGNVRRAYTVPGITRPLTIWEAA